LLEANDEVVLQAPPGADKTTIDGQVYEWGPRDIFIAPSWKWIEHEAETEAVVFSYSDRVAQQKLGLWREQRYQD